MASCRAIGARTLEARATVAYADTLHERGDTASTAKAGHLQAEAATARADLGLPAVTRN